MTNELDGTIVLSLFVTPYHSSRKKTHKNNISCNKFPYRKKR